MHTIEFHARVGNKEEGMSEEPGVGRFAVERVPLPPMPYSTTCHWAGMAAVSRYIGPHTDLEPTSLDRQVARLLTHTFLQAQDQTGTGWHTNPSMTSGDLGLCP
jgi:hypothetical protein